MDTNKMTMEELATWYHARDTAPRIVMGVEIPYIEHPRSVVRKLMSWGCTNAMGSHGWRLLDIAWGHDLLEDTKISPAEIAKAAGDDVLRCIDLLSNLQGRHADKDAYLLHVADHANIATLLVKVADRLCNTEDFLAGGSRNKTRYFENAEPVFRRLWNEWKIRRRRIAEDKTPPTPEDDDVATASILSNAVAEVGRMGEKLGVRWIL